MKKGFLFRKSLLAFSMMFSLGTISSCSAFFGGDDFAITDTTIEQNENGDTIVTITFSGDNIEPLTFTIPKVQNGIDGNGIASITPVLTEEGSIELTIKYTDTTMEDTVITIPVIKGDTGVGINEVLIGSDEDGNTTIQFTYTNGTTSDLITIPKGIDGENGIGIANIDVQKTSTGLNIVTITFTDETMAPVNFTVNDGVSIAKESLRTNYLEFLIKNNLYAYDITHKLFPLTNNKDKAMKVLSKTLNGYERPIDYVYSLKRK